MNQGLLLLQGGCFPALGVFGCCCSVGCEAVGTQYLSPGPCVFRPEEVVTLAVDLLTHSPVVSLVVSLPTLLELPLRTLQSPTSRLGLIVAHSGWDGGRCSLAVPALG